MQQTINFNSKQIISKEELLLWDESLRELFGNFLRYNRGTSQVGGIIDGYDSDTSTFLNDFFKVEIGGTPSGGYNTIKIGTGKGILNFESTTDEKLTVPLTTYNEALKRQIVTLLKWEETDNIVVDGIAGYTTGNVVYVGFTPQWNPMEAGLCALSTNNQVTISGGDFTKLRSQSTKNPTKIRFYLEDGSVANNGEIYEVISIVSPTQIIVGGSLTVETNLRYVIVGSYDLSAQGNLTDKFAYPTAAGKLTFTLTSTDITSVGGFIIASLTFGSAGAFSINDLRLSNLFTFAYSPNIVYTVGNQTISGQKTFTGSPIMGAPVTDKIEPNSIIAPLQITSNNLTVLHTGGNVFKVKCDSTHYLLKKIFFDTTFAYGQRIYLWVDPTGDAIYLDSTNAAGGLIYLDADGVESSGLIPANSIIELWVDTSSRWHVTNFTYTTPEYSWQTVSDLFDGAAVPLSTVTNVVKYKIDGNKLALYIEKISATVYPVLFSFEFILPHLPAFKVVEPLTWDYSTSTTNSITINTNGLCSIASTDVIGTINKMIVIYL